MTRIKNPTSLTSAACMLAVVGLAAGTAAAQQSTTDRDNDRQQRQSQPRDARNNQNDTRDRMQDRDRAMQGRDANRQPGDRVGQDEEQWYDPSDWFDDEFRDGDRAGMDRTDRYDRRRWEGSEGDTFSYSYDDSARDVATTLYADGYYDGYYDGYHDDRFGYDYFGIAGRQKGPDAMSDGYRKEMRDQRQANDAARRQTGDDRPQGDAMRQRERDRAQSEGEWQNQSDARQRNIRNERYVQGYEAGYYDGFYDQANGYNADWTYYVFAMPVNQAEQNDSMTDRDRKARDNRLADRSRARGDRMGEVWRTPVLAKSHTGDAGMEHTNVETPPHYEGDKANRDRRPGQQAMNGSANNGRDREAWGQSYASDTRQVRGTVKKVVTKADLNEGVRDHVLEITFEDGRTVVASFGPGVDITAVHTGNRVTLRGVETERNGRDVIQVERLASNDRVLWRSGTAS